MKKLTISDVNALNYCPKKFEENIIKYRKAVPSYFYKNDAILGEALHTYAETGSMKKAQRRLMSGAPCLSWGMCGEVQRLIKACKAFDSLELKFKNPEFEKVIESGGFYGIADIVDHESNKVINIYDVKFSRSRPSKSGEMQLNVYRHFLEIGGYEVKKMALIWISDGVEFLPNFAYDERAYFKAAKASTSEAKIIPVEKNEAYVTEFLSGINKAENFESMPPIMGAKCKNCRLRFECETGETDPDFLPDYYTRDFNHMTVFIWGKKSLAKMMDFLKNDITLLIEKPEDFGKLEIYGVESCLLSLEAFEKMPLIEAKKMIFKIVNHGFKNVYIISESEEVEKIGSREVTHPHMSKVVKYAGGVSDFSLYYNNDNFLTSDMTYSIACFGRLMIRSEKIPASLEKIRNLYEIKNTEFLEEKAKRKKHEKRGASLPFCFT